jgi:hypothetical protein
MAGLAFESLCHSILQEGYELTLRPMQKTFAPTLFHWNAQGEEQTSNSMDLDSSQITVDIPSNTAIVYTGMQTQVQPNRLYVPRARNQRALDSFFLLDENLYIFQMTISNTHDIKRQIETFFTGQPNIPPKTSWRFVFITPPGSDVDVKGTPGVEHFLEGVTLYSAHIEVENQMLIAPPAP